MLHVLVTEGVVTFSMVETVPGVSVAITWIGARIMVRINVKSRILVFEGVISVHLDGFYNTSGHSSRSSELEAL